VNLNEIQVLFVLDLNLVFLKGFIMVSLFYKSWMFEVLIDNFIF
jgi:hypothetical protein